MMLLLMVTSVKSNARKTTAKKPTKKIVKKLITTKEDIALLTYSIPDGSNGDRLLDFELIKFLSKNYRVHLICQATQDQQYYDNTLLQKYLQSFTLIPTHLHSSNLTNKITNLATKLPEEVKNIDREISKIATTDLISTQSITKLLFTSVWATAYVDQSLIKKIPSFMLVQNIEEEQYESYDGNLITRVKQSWERARVKWFEDYVLNQFKNIATVTEKNKEKLLKIINNKTISVIKPILEEQKSTLKAVKNNSLLITSNANIMTNRVSMKWFMDKVWPELDTSITLTITGKDYKNCFKTIEKNHSRVTYLGFLKDSELNKTFEKTHIVINPSRIGSGFKIKSLDALSRGKKLISTDFGNHFGKEILSSDNAQELAELINQAVLGKQKDLTFNYKKYYDNAIKEFSKFFN